ncbi:unnamed protein product [Clonostachys rosea f. rosea IK726]|uniref:Uncharacterized protein n=2 Tax=Bionectria ochroleuca TaxID=29856 RepID=A0A0B7KJZ1_BIOOC|nr:unnamed protein product [Clonostachys rosea f. rosea IK726]
METVTSTVLLHRVEELADPDERNDFHIRGTVSLLSRIGLVEYDEFGASIIRETYGLLLPYNTTTV